METTRRVSPMTPAGTHKWVPIVDDDLCTGCGACVEACGPRCLELVVGKPLLVRPHDCGSEEHCIAPCQEDAIWMTWLPWEGDHGRGKWKDATV